MHYISWGSHSVSLHNFECLSIYKDALIYSSVVTDCTHEYNYQQHLFDTLAAAMPDGIDYTFMTVCPFSGTKVL